VESKAEAEPKSKVEAEAEAEARPESKVEAEAEAEAESKPEPEPAKDLLDEDPRHIAAARTVRVMLADLVLYHPKQIEEGVRENDFLERNKAALADIQETYESRVPADVRAQRDHLQAGIDTLIVKKRKELGLQ
jgi:hypothetical protein